MGLRRDISSGCPLLISPAVGAVARVWDAVLGPGSGRLIGFGREGLLTEAGNVLERVGGKGRAEGDEENLLPRGMSCWEPGVEGSQAIHLLLLGMSKAL